MGVSKRFACRVTGQSRTTQRHQAQAETPADPDAGLRAWLRQYAKDHPRRGFRPASHDARAEGWIVNHKKLQRICREEGLRVPIRRPRKRLGASTAPGTPTADAPTRRLGRACAARADGIRNQEERCCADSLQLPSRPDAALRTVGRPRCARCSDPVSDVEPCKSAHYRSQNQASDHLPSRPCCLKLSSPATLRRRRDEAMLTRHFHGASGCDVIPQAHVPYLGTRSTSHWCLTWCAACIQFDG
jgi:hypothetical protein